VAIQASAETFSTVRAAAPQNVEPEFVWLVTAVWATSPRVKLYMGGFTHSPLEGLADMGLHFERLHVRSSLMDGPGHACICPVWGKYMPRPAPK